MPRSLEGRGGSRTLRSFVTATVTKGSASVANYRATVTLPLRGTWTLKAWHQDDEHAESYSAGRSVTVR